MSKYFCTKCERPIKYRSKEESTLFVEKILKKKGQISKKYALKNGIENLAITIGSLSLKGYLFQLYDQLGEDIYIMIRKELSKKEKSKMQFIDYSVNNAKFLDKLIKKI